MIEENKPIHKKKSYAGPNVAESGIDKDRGFDGVMSSSYYYALYSSQLLR
ncbi:MAG: hypothetical protein FWE24_04850 [Defluviitaleaceae bacterium]|nr:hypothetical protein [Defluviitaleaceae bacterium]